VFAALVPIVAVKGDPLSALNVSLGRLAGVVGGIGLGIAVTEGLGVSALSVGVLVLVGLLGGLLVRIGGEPNTQVAVSALLLLAVTANVEDFGLERLWETAVGAAVTVALAPILWPPDPVRELERRLDALAERIADDVALTCALVGGPERAAVDNLGDVVEHTRDATRLVDALGALARGLRLNPLRRRDRARLGPLEARVRRAADAAHGARRLARDVAGLAGRADLGEAWAAAAVPAQVAGQAVVATVRDALAGRPAAADAVRASAALRDWRDADLDPVAVVLRRDLRTLLEDVADTQV
jgi:hypothetical protein